MQEGLIKFKSSLQDRCYRFSLDLIVFISSVPKSNVTSIICNQLLRSGTSIGANLVEVTASSSRLEFKKFQEISLKSANETIYWLGLLRDSELANNAKVNNLLVEVDELSRMIAAGIMKLKSKKF